MIPVVAVSEMGKVQSESVRNCGVNASFVLGRLRKVFLERSAIEGDSPVNGDPVQQTWLVSE